MKYSALGVCILLSLSLVVLSGCDLFSDPGLGVVIRPSVVVGKPPLVVHMQAEVDASAVTPLSYQWHFGDAASGLGDPVQHRYIASGDYKVNLVITDALGNVGRAEQIIKVIDFSLNSQVTEPGAGALASGDFNNDNIPDLAVANRTEGHLALFFGQNDGRFEWVRSLGDGNNFSDVITADFDGDGETDIAVTDLVNSVVHVYTGNGRGSFKGPFTARIFEQNFLVASGPLGLSAGDFDGDGMLDVVTVNQTTNNISVLLGDGEGGLRLAHVFSGHRLGDLIHVQRADVDQDGRDDVVVLNATTRQAEVFLSRGDGTFFFHLEVSGGEGPSDLAVHDLDRDGFDDIAIANAQGGDVSLWWGRPNTRFDHPGRWTMGAVPDQLAVGDLDGDGHTDLISIDRQAGTLSVALAQGDRSILESNRSFEAPFEFAVGETLDSVQFHDINGDGQRDVTVSEANGKVNVLLNLTPAP